MNSNSNYTDSVLPHGIYFTYFSLFCLLQDLNKLRFNETLTKHSAVMLQMSIRC